MTKRDTGKGKRRFGKKKIKFITDIFLLFINNISDYNKYLL